VRVISTYLALKPDAKIGQTSTLLKMPTGEVASVLW
jgi:hypothetical protein